MQVIVVIQPQQGQILVLELPEVVAQVVKPLLLSVIHDAPDNRHSNNNDVEISNLSGIS